MARKEVTEISKVFNLLPGTTMVDKECIMDLLMKYKRFLEDKGYTVAGVYLKGSQNYNLSDSESDVDATAIVIPSIGNLVARVDLTNKYKFNTGEVTLNDPYAFAKHTVKGNCSWIEQIHTEYFVGDSLDFLKPFPVKADSMVHMCKEKYAALSKRYPAKVDIIDKFGFDPKQLHHIIRLTRTVINSLTPTLGSRCLAPCYMAEGFLNEGEYKELMSLKRDAIWEGKVINVYEARAIAKVHMDTIESMAKFFPFIQQEIPMKEIENLMVRYYKELM